MGEQGYSRTQRKLKKKKSETEHKDAKIVVPNEDNKGYFYSALHLKDTRRGSIRKNRECCMKEREC